jgi:hypothetical protein
MNVASAPAAVAGGGRQEVRLPATFQWLHHASMVLWQSTRLHPAVAWQQWIASHAAAMDD